MISNAETGHSPELDSLDSALEQLLRDPVKREQIAQLVRPNDQRALLEQQGVSLPPTINVVGSPSELMYAVKNLLKSKMPDNGLTEYLSQQIKDFAKMFGEHTSLVRGEKRSDRV